MPDSDLAIKNYMKTTGFVSGEFWLLTCVIQDYYFKWSKNLLKNAKMVILRCHYYIMGCGGLFYLNTVFPEKIWKIRPKNGQTLRKLVRAWEKKSFKRVRTTESASTLVLFHKNFFIRSFFIGFGKKLRISV